MCFLSFVGGMNATLCCNKRVCSECYVQVQMPPGSQPQKDCPFCMRSSFVAIYRVLTQADIAAEKEEQEKVEKLEQQKRMSETMRALSAKTVPVAMADVFAAPDKGKTDEQEEAADGDDDDGHGDENSAEMTQRAVEMSLREEAERINVVAVPRPDVGDAGRVGAGFGGEDVSTEDDPEMRLAIQLSLAESNRLQNDW